MVDFKNSFVVVVVLTLLSCQLLFGTEKRTKIAVIDTGIKQYSLLSYLCESGHKDFTGRGIKDTFGHGTMVAELIAKNLDPNKECLLILKYHLPDSGNAVRMLSAFIYAYQQKVKYINVSGGGYETLNKERDIIQKLLKSKVRVVVSSGNEGQNLDKKCNFYPACYYPKDPNMYVIGSTEGTPNYGDTVVKAKRPWRICEKGKCTSGGTSISTAIFTGELVKKERTCQE